MTTVDAIRGSTAPPDTTLNATRAGMASVRHVRVDGRLDGKIEVSTRAIAAIAARAAAGCPGVAGLASRHGGLLQRERLAAAHAARGVEVRVVDGGVVVEIWVTLERGVRVIEVAHAIMISVTYAVEEALGLCVAHVNINVQALAGSR